MALDNKIALVTGAGMGMGRAIALALADEGADVAVAEINGEAVEDTSIAVRERGRQSAAVHADIGNLDDIDRMVKETVDRLGQHDINVNAICPGSTLTPMLEALMAERSQQLGVNISELEKQRTARIPIGRPNDPEDIAAMAVFLAGPGARNITGQAYNVDGGLVMH